MAGMNKQQFNDLYRILIEPRIMADPLAPNLDELGLKGSVKVKLHYHSHIFKPLLKHRWSRILFDLVKLTSSDKVVVVGAAFGWGVEALIELVPGITVIGIDTSDYIEANKSVDENADLIAEILKETTYVGESPQGLSNRGQAIYDYCKTPEGIPRTTAIVLKEDLLSNQSRNKVKKALSNSAPTFIVTEDIMQNLTDAEIAIWVREIEKLPSVTIIHIVTKESPRTIEELNALTGHKVIVIGEYRSVG